MKIADYLSNSSPRIDWKTERDRVDLTAVATRLLGPASKRQGGRLFWRCPFHDDNDPSFFVDEIRKRWKCYPCGIGGDVIELVTRLNGGTFPEVVAFITGGPMPSGKSPPRAQPEKSPKPKPPAGPSGLPEAEALALVESAAARLWTPEGANALDYLTGPKRCLNVETIRSVRLGVTSWTSIPKADGSSFRALGVVIPWFDRNKRLALVKLRQPDGQRPKYAEVYRNPARLVCYPSAATVRPGRPLVVTEGEFDALALGEVLGELCAVVTLGSASARPEAAALGSMLAAPRWFIATDADEAGDKSADGWPARAQRVRPPQPYKDWTEAKAAGVDLARWWRGVLDGNLAPSSFTEEEQTAQAFILDVIESREVKYGGWAWIVQRFEAAGGCRETLARSLAALEVLGRVVKTGGHGTPHQMLVHLAGEGRSYPEKPTPNAHAPDGVCGK